MNISNSYSKPDFNSADVLNKLKKNMETNSTENTDTLTLSFENSESTEGQNASLLRQLKSAVKSSEQQSEAYSKAFDDMNKALEISRRISKGGRVPPEDEMRLLSFNREMYILAKLAAMNAKKHKKYDSVDENEDKKQYYTPEEHSPDSDNTETEGSADMPPVSEISEASDREGASEQPSSSQLNSVIFPQYRLGQ